ncbi:DMT family transporter [Devosia sp.]|uniref:DMT family transporter n=1 Tax=Devosia sp. TaxID=1871048 RepID=UPI003A92D124
MPTKPALTPPAVRPLALAGIVLAIAGAGFFATKGIVIKLALAEGIDSVTTLTWRMIVAVPIFVAVGIIYYRRQLTTAPTGTRTRLTLGSLLQVLGVGVLGYYVASFLDFQALEYITAQLDRLILLTYPFFVVLLGAIFFRRKITVQMVTALVLSYVGIALIFAHDLTIEGEDVLLGSLLVFGAALAYAVYQLLAKPLIDRMGPQLFTSIAMSGAGPAVIIHFLLTHPMSDLAVSGNGFALMLAIGTMSTVVPAYCISGAIGLIGPERTAIIGNISPLVTVALAIFILGEPFTIWHAAGTALVVFGVWLFTRKQKPKTKVLEEVTSA